jgi:hypothetical protein
VVHRRVDEVDAADDVVRVVEALDEVAEPLGRVRGQVVDALEPVLAEQPLDEPDVRDGALDEGAARVDVLLEPAAQVVQHDDLVAGSGQLSGEVGADEATASRH